MMKSAHHPEPVTTRSPWAFVPLLYFLEGLPYVIVTGVSVLLLKSLALEFPHLRIENDAIAFWTTIIGLPWALKMLWGPVVDFTMTKRRWIVLTQLVLLGGMLGLAFAIQLPSFFSAVLVILLLMAFVSATHDIAADGFYLLSLNKDDQAFFVGVRSTFYRLATIFGTGFLVVAAGQLEKLAMRPFTEASYAAIEAAARIGTGWLAFTPEQAEELGMVKDRLPIATALEPAYRALETTIPHFVVRAWTLAVLIGAAAYAVAWVINAVLMPKPALDTSGGITPASAEVAVSPIQPEPEPEPQPEAEPVPAAGRQSFVHAITEFLDRPKIGWILMFILFYRFGESMIGKISQLFLKDPLDKGGLGLETDVIGLISGTWGILALVIGGILGGIFIAKMGFSRSIWPMVMAMNLPNLFYIWAAINQPGPDIVRWLVVTDQFGYGFGFSAYMVYLMIVARGTAHPTSSYAVATGLMAVGATIAGTTSGALQVQMGYTNFFILVVLLGIPGMITLFFIPKEESEMAFEGTGEEDLDALLRSRQKWVPLAVLAGAVLLFLAITFYPMILEALK